VRTLPSASDVFTLVLPASHPNYPYYQARLFKGWIFGRNIVSYGYFSSSPIQCRAIQDNSDAQYRSFRNNLSSLTALALFYMASKRVFARVRLTMADTGNQLFLIPFFTAFSILMLLGLHGTSLLKILTILSLNYVIAILCKGSKLGPALTWLFNGAILFANDRNNGYSFGSIYPGLASLVCV
jgi:protein-cysteine N-palmitoyltransferase HHAT